MRSYRPGMSFMAAALALGVSRLEEAKHTHETRFHADQFRQPVRGKVRRILTLKEAHERVHELISITEVLPRGAQRDGVRFYVNDHCFGLGPDIKRILPENFVPCSINIGRRTIAPREGFESGVLTNASDEIRFANYCNPEEGVIESLDVLVHYLNEHYTLADLEKE